jgi:hypothetical protein
MPELLRNNGYLLSTATSSWQCSSRSSSARCGCVPILAASQRAAARFRKDPCGIGSADSRVAFNECWPSPHRVRAKDLSVLEDRMLLSRVITRLSSYHNLPGMTCDRAVISPVRFIHWQLSLDERSQFTRIEQLSHPANCSPFCSTKKKAVKCFQGRALVAA